MKLLFIEWEDSCQGRGWEPTENFCHTRSMRCFSVGWKVAESQRLGVWSDPDAIPPWRWRKQHNLPEQDN